MKKIMSIVSVMVAVFLASPVLAQSGDGYFIGKVDYSQSPFGSGSGGEFRITEDTIGVFNNLPLTSYSSDTAGTKGNGKEYFQTFCIERNENISNNMTIYVSTEGVNEATGNPTGQPGSHAWNGGVDKNLGDNLNSKTAYLYDQFARGTLVNYDYSGNPGRRASAEALQRLIWLEEGEITAGQLNNGLNAAQQQLIADWNNAYANSGWTGIGNVRVLQSYNSPLKQDLLVLIPLPGAVLLGMLGFGTAGLKLRRRR